MKILYFDTETTGLDHTKQEMIQFSAIVDIDGVVVEEINLHIQPTRWDVIEESAMETTGITIEQMKTFMLPNVAFTQIREFFDRHIDKFDRSDKFYPAGHNVSFDINFLQSFWRNYDKYGTGSYQNWRAIDTRIIANWLIMSGKIPDLADVKLSTLCEYFNISINAHDSLSDIRATRKLSQKMKDLLL